MIKDIVVAALAEKYWKRRYSLFIVTLVSAPLPYGVIRIIFRQNTFIYDTGLRKWMLWKEMTTYYYLRFTN